MLTVLRRSVFQAFPWGVVLVISFAPFAHPQKGQSGSSPTPQGGMKSSGGLSTFDQRDLIIRSTDEFAPKKTEETTCFLPPLTGVHSSTIGVASLQAQAKAKAEFAKVCSVLAEKKYDEAEKRLRKALEKYPDYAALSVLLGQILESRQQLKEGRESCLRASVANSDYVPAYLCLADIAARNENWNEVLKESDRALALDPASNRITYLYSGTAKFNLRLLDQAQDVVLKGLDIDKANPDPRMHYLLAQIYEAKGDRTNEEAQLRLCLKLSAGAKDEQTIKRYLSNLENTPNTTQTEHAAK